MVLIRTTKQVQIMLTPSGDGVERCKKHFMRHCLLPQTLKTARVSSFGLMLLFRDNEELQRELKWMANRGMYFPFIPISRKHL